MGTAFWIRRFLVVFAGAFVIIAGVAVLKGHAMDESVVQGLLWGAASAALFTGSRIWQSRRGVHCAICRDTPEMQAGVTAGRPDP